jgi:hypothetical protein
MKNADEAVNPSPEGSPVARKGGRKKGWNYFTTRSEAEGELRTIVNLVKLGQIEPARANSAIYGLSTFLSPVRSPPRRGDGRSGSGTNRGDRGQQAEGRRARGTN